MAQANWEHERSRAESDLNRWVAEFTPLMFDTETLSSDQLKSNLRLIAELRETSETLQAEPRDRIDLELAHTFEQAVGQLDSLEHDFRMRLGRTAPGDPESLADLRVLQARLAEREAEQELGLATDAEIPAILDLRTGDPNVGAAVGMGTFGFAWTSFTTFHCFMMVGGTTKSFGWGALGLLGFYSIFFLVGFAMLAGAVLALCRESVEISGRVLTIHRRLGRFDFKKVIHLMEGEPVRVGPVSNTRNNESGPSVAILLTDRNGKEHTVGQGLATVQREKTAAKINDYLAAQPKES